MAELIGNAYFVVSKNSGVIYRINKDLRCSCKAGIYGKTCSHVKEVINDLNKGRFVETKKTLLTKQYSYQGNNLFMGSEQAKFF